MRTGVFAVATLALALASSDVRATPKRRVVDRIVAVVDGACITMRELERYALPQEKSAYSNAKPNEELEAITRRVRQEALNALVDRLLLGREASRLKLTATPDEVDRAIDLVGAGNGLDRAGVLAAAAAQGLDAARYREEIRVQLVEGRLLVLDAPRRYADWNALGPEARSVRMSDARRALVLELRARAFVEVRP